VLSPEEVARFLDAAPGLKSEAELLGILTAVAEAPSVSLPATTMRVKERLGASSLWERSARRGGILPIWQMPREVPSTEPDRYDWKDFDFSREARFLLNIFSATDKAPAARDDYVRNNQQPHPTVRKTGGANPKRTSDVPKFR